MLDILDLLGALQRDAEAQHMRLLALAGLVNEMESILYSDRMTSAEQHNYLVEIHDRMKKGFGWES